MEWETARPSILKLVIQFLMGQPCWKVAYFLILMSSFLWWGHSIQFDEVWLSYYYIPTPVAPSAGTALQTLPRAPSHRSVPTDVILRPNGAPLAERSRDTCCQGNPWPPLSAALLSVLVQRFVWSRSRKIQATVPLPSRLHRRILQHRYVERANYTKHQPATNDTPCISSPNLLFPQT